MRPSTTGEVRFGSDSYYIPSFLSHQTSNECWSSLIGTHEVDWYLHYFNHHGSLQSVDRLTSTQYLSDDQQLIPWYRYPINNQQNHPQTPFTKSIQKLAFLCGEWLCQPLNHSVVNLYRDGKDYIPFHADNTLDIKEASFIATINLGAAREYALKSEDGESMTISLEHGSLLVLGPETNGSWQHSIVKDDTIRSPRISVTMRYVATFLNRSNHWIMGQGEKHQDINYPLSPFNDHILTHSPDKIAFHHDCTHELAVSADTAVGGDGRDSVLYHPDTLHSSLTVRDSHFHGMLFSVQSVDEGMDCIRRVRARYPQKGHAPFALVYDGQTICGDDQEWDRVDIGQSLVKMLCAADMNRVLIVVVRHWKGSFLGEPKLKGAYTACAQGVICRAGGPEARSELKCRVYRYASNGKDVVFQQRSRSKL